MTALQGNKIKLRIPETTVNMKMEVQGINNICCTFSS